MTPIQECILNKRIDRTPIWLMRQAGRYLPEFRKIRRLNPDFVNLCLNENKSSRITLQPLERFDLDAAIIFSDILMVPYGLGQNLIFKKKIGPQLEDINFEKLKRIKKKEFLEKLSPVYKIVKKVKKNSIVKNKDVIGFVGAPWTLLVYMINKTSPKNKILNNFFKNKILIDQLLLILEKFLKIHIENQVKNGASIIQIFDSWAGLLKEKDLEKYVYLPTSNLVKFVKSLDVPVICFPRNIKNYKKFCDEVNPDVINIDYNVNITNISEKIHIPIQGGLNPNILLSNKDDLKKEALKYLNTFKNHPYIFNLGHGVLPNTDPNMVEYLIKLVKNYS
mgnify:FL=1